MSGIATAIAVTAGATIYAGNQAGKASKSAANAQERGTEAGIAETRRQFDITEANLQPRIEAGDRALGQQEAILGLSGQEAQQQAFAAFNESPGQKFMRDRAQKNLLRNSSAIGGLGGGNVRSALVEQGVGFAQQDFQNQFGRLGQIAGQDQNAATNVGQFGAQAAGNIANLGVAGSEARASGILGASQARSNTVNQIAGLGGMALGYMNQPQTQFNPGGGMSGFSDKRLKDNIKEISRDDLGGVYSFTYKSNPNQVYKGRMAQELLDTRPDAVSMHESGFLMVTNEFRPELI